MQFLPISATKKTKAPAAKESLAVHLYQIIDALQMYLLSFGDCLCQKLLAPPPLPLSKRLCPQ